MDVINTKLVSIIVTCYNHEKYIGECIQSLLSQKYENIEVLITDDCSKDESCQIIENFREKMENRFTKVVLIKNAHNIGAVKSINHMINLSKGNYIKLLDGDDMLFPNAITDLVSFLSQNISYGLVYSNYVMCDICDRFNTERLSKKKIFVSPSVPDNITQALFENDFIVTPTVLIRKRVYDEVGLHDENLSIADWEFWIRVSLRFPIGHLNCTTAAYRIVPDSMSRFTMDNAGRERLMRMMENEFKILDKYKDYPMIRDKDGIRKCCNQGISVAIDIEADEVAEYIKRYLKYNRVTLDIKMEIKYLLFKIGIWRHIAKQILRRERKYS